MSVKIVHTHLSYTNEKARNIWLGKMLQLANVPHSFLILVYMILSGKGSSNWLWSTWCSLVTYFFDKSILSCFKYCFFVVVVVVVLYLVERWRTTLPSICKVQLLPSVAVSILITCFVLLYSHKSAHPICYHCLLNPCGVNYSPQRTC